MKSRTIERGISCLLFIAIVISLMTWWDAWNLAHKRDVSAGWPNPTISVRNSACPARTGVFLVACDYQGNFMHYSDLSAKSLSPEDQILIGDMGRATDDIGQAFFLNMVAAVSGEPQRATKVGQINFVLNLTGLLLLWILVFRFGGLMGNFALLIFGLISVNEKIVVPWHSLVEFFINTTSHGNFFGVSILAILPAIALIEITKSREARKPSTKLFHITLGSMALVGFAIAAMMRESLAISGFVALVVTVPFLWTREIGWRRMSLILGYGLVCLIILKIQYIITVLGGFLYQLPHPETVIGHGMAFSLVTGLGVIPNGFGLIGTDVDTIAMMARLHPDLVYGNQDFYAALSDWFVQAVLSDPLEVIRIYITKFLYILVHSGNFIIMLVSSLVFWLGYRRFQAEYPAKLRNCYKLYGIAIIVMLFMVIVQGVLVFIFDHYLYPIYIFCLMLFSIGFGRLLPIDFKRNR
ncbi:MAG: hypothetical protein ORO03_09195 [Alphaproteobacteria bacterium]|nr:hypothetical protein [Alphaproteobacteria bacterium]